jgi:hypothetical protein
MSLHQLLPQEFPAVPMPGVDLPGFPPSFGNREHCQCPREGKGKGKRKEKGKG